MAVYSDTASRSSRVRMQFVGNHQDSHPSNAARTAVRRRWASLFVGSRVSRASGLPLRRARGARSESARAGRASGSGRSRSRGGAGFGGRVALLARGLPTGAQRADRQSPNRLAHEVREARSSGSARPSRGNALAAFVALTRAALVLHDGAVADECAGPRLAIAADAPRSSPPSGVDGSGTERARPQEPAERDRNDCCDDGGR